jgi:peptidoglycan/LPS O-acetylase OafA/YrhL
MTEQVRYGNIDALRGLAATLVIVRHGSDTMCGVPAVLHTGAALCGLSHGVDIGRMGVVAFFAISGFVIYPTIRGTPWAGTRTFLIRRFFRIYPAYWVSLVIGYLALWVWFGKSLTPLQLAANVSMLSSVFAAPYVMGQYWTLEVELVFYALIVALFLAGAVRSSIVLAAMVVACIALQTSMALKWISVDVEPQWGVIGLNLATMFWGALFRQWHDFTRRADALRTGTRNPALLLTAMTLAIVVPLLVVALRNRHPEALPAILGHLLGVGAFATTVLLVRGVPRALAWLGAISYSLYLLHPIAMYPIWEIARRPGGALAGLGIAPLLGLTFALSIVLAAASYYGVERPAIAAGRRLTRNGA